MRRYLVVRAGCYENLLRAAPAAVANTKGYLLAFADELVFHRRRTSPSRNRHGVSPSNSFILQGGTAPLRLGYRDISEVSTDGSRIIIRLHTLPPAVSLSLEPNSYPATMSLPSSIPQQLAARRQSRVQSALNQLTGGLLTRTRSNSPPPRSFPPNRSASPSRPPNPPGGIGHRRRLSRLGASALFGPSGNDSMDPQVFTMDLESTTACTQMQVCKMLFSID